MGKFDGYLICSDFDGTFATGGTPVEGNLEAVRYFTENGGRFTFATGRSVDFILEKGLADGVINAPACLCNGSVVYDYAGETLLRERTLGFTVAAFLESLGEAAAAVRFIYIFPENLEKSICFEDKDAIPPKHLEQRASKLLCKFETPEQADAFKQRVQQLPFFRDTYISKSWGIGVEFNAWDATKGHALQFIKKYLGDIHTAIGIGDYENDVPLVAYADIGVAVENAVDCVKQAAKWCVKPCKEGAIKDLIDRLDREV